MKKNIFFFIIFSIIFTNLFAEQIVLERNVTNRVQRYYDKKWFEEDGTVSIYLQEFTNDAGKKFGWVSAIKSNMLNNSGEITPLNDENECPLMYYIDGDHFYIGEVWTTSYVNEVIKSHVFYDFNKEDGYGLLFMYAYAIAVNPLLTYDNKITLNETYDENGRNKFITNDNESNYDLYFNTGDFNEYRKKSTVRLENGEVDGELVWIDGEWRDILNKNYTDQNGVTWRAHYDVTGFHVKSSSDGSRIRWYEPAIIFPAFRTVCMRLVKDATTKSSIDAGKKISENLKKYGLWKAKSPMYQGDGTTLGKHGGIEGVITCWYEPFSDRSGPSPGLASKTKDLLINYEKIIPKKVN